MKKTILTIVFVAATLVANAFESRFFSVDFDKMELNQDGHKYELVEVSKKELVRGRVVTYRCIDSEGLQAVSFKLLVSDKGNFIKYKKCNLE